MWKTLIRKANFRLNQDEFDRQIIRSLILADIFVGPLVVISYFLMGAESSAKYLFVGLLVCTPIMIQLLKSNYLTLSKHFFIFSCCLYIYLLSFGLDHKGSVHLLCLPAALLAFLLFNLTERKMIGISLLITVSTWILVFWAPEFSHYLKGQETIAVDVNYFFVNLAISFILILLFMFIFAKNAENKKTAEFSVLKETKLELRKTLDQLDQFFSLNLNVFLIGNRDGYIVKMNSLLPKITGYTFEEMMARPFTDFIHPQDVDKSKDALTRVLNGESIVNFENRYKCMDGTLRILNWSCILSPSGDQIYATAVDVTNHNIQQRERDRLFEAITQSAIFTTTDSRGRILTVNDKFCELSGYSAEELIGKDHRIINSGTHSPDFFRDMWQTIKSGNVWYGEIENKAKDGHHYFVSTVITPVLNVLGEVEKYIAIRFDRTKEHELLLQLQGEQAKLAHTSKLASLGEISSGIAHEINNPLTIITGGIMILKRLHDEPDKFRQQCDKIEGAANRIVRIIDALRSYSNQSGLKNIIEKPIKEILEDAILLTKGIADQNEVKVEVSIQTGSTVLCNEIELRQVFTQIIFNAIDASKLYVDKWIKVLAFEESDELVIQVIDSGRGIPPEIQEKLFQPFFTTKKIGQGTGLGLCISKGILDRHNGRIKVRFLEGHTCFEVRFDKLDSVAVSA